MESKHPAANCSECPLREKGKYVPSTFSSTSQYGNYGKKIALIGESPGRTEVAKGAPFLGPSGEVMNAVLKEHGLDRREMLVSNAIACYYSDTDFDKPPPEAVVACRPRLLDEMKQFNIDTAITVGAVAATSLLDTKIGITKLRAGAPRLSEYCLEAGGGVYVIPTFHPAFALRDQSKFPYIVRDVAKIKPGGVWGKWKDPRFEVVSVPSVATKWINRLFDSEYKGPLEVDVEAGAEKDETFGGAINEMLCIGVWAEDYDCVIVFTPDSFNRFNRKLLGKLFMDRSIVAQNGKYDTGRCLNTYLGDENELLDIFVAFDTMLASYALDEGKGVHSLEYMQSEYLGAPDYKKWIDESIARTKARMRAEARAAKRPLKGLFASGKDFSLVEPAVLYKYNSFDVYGTHLLRVDKFEKELVDGRVDSLFEWLMKISHMLVHVEQNGLAVDLDYNAQLEIEFRDMLNDVEFVGTKEGFNPNSPQQVKKYLAAIGVHTGSTDKTILRGLIERYGMLGRDDVVEFCQSLLDHRGASKQMGTYITGLRRSLIEGVAHPSFELRTTATGRPSCRNPNLQNIPRGSNMRRQFVPSSSNRIFVQADYSQAEFRVLAWLAQDELVRQMFNDSSIDVFTGLCQEMYGSKWNNASKVDKKEMRTMIKTMAYGIMYGREAKAIGIAFNISLAEAKRQMKMFCDIVPGIMQWQKKIKAQVFNGEDLVNPFGRRRRFHLITNTNIVTVMNEALSSLPQGTASDICLESARQLDDYGHQLRNIVHDSILIECDRRDVAGTAQAMREVMVGTAERVTEGYVRFDVDIEVGPTWGDLVPLENYLQQMV